MTTTPHSVSGALPMQVEPFLAQLRRVNTDRYEAWVGDGQDAGILFDAAELGGEVGELLNVVKKLEREERGWRGSRAAPEDFADECADVLICLDKLARRRGVDLAEATVRKFNATSDKVGLPHKLALAKPEGETVTDDGVLAEADAEVERILSLSDEQVLAEASPEDLAWAKLFKARMIAIKHALPGRYDGVSTHATIRGDADDAPYMLAIREALSSSPKPTTVESSGMVEGIRAVTAEMRRLMPNACGDWADKIDAFLRGDLPSQNGTFACPICGQDTPHHHTPAVVDAYHNKRSRT